MRQHGEEGDWIAEEGDNPAQLIVAPIPPLRVQKCLYLFGAEPKSQGASRYPSYHGILGDIVRNEGPGTDTGTVPMGRVSHQTDHGLISSGAILANARVEQTGSPRQVGMVTDGRM
jgi:hypothetical protein